MKTQPEIRWNIDVGLTAAQENKVLREVVKLMLSNMQQFPPGEREQHEGALSLLVSHVEARPALDLTVGFDLVDRLKQEIGEAWREKIAANSRLALEHRRRFPLGEEYAETAPKGGHTATPPLFLSV